MFENAFGQLFQTERLKRITVTDDFGERHVHDRLLRFLRRCINGLDHPFALPEIPCYLNEILACEDFEDCRPRRSRGSSLTKPECLVSPMTAPASAITRECVMSRDCLKRREDERDRAHYLGTSHLSL